MLTGTNGENWFNAQDTISRDWVINAIPIGEAFTLRFRADKSDFNVADISSLISLHTAFVNANRVLNVIYCINVMTGVAADHFANLQTVIGAGVIVVAVEFGNETYSGSQTNFVFSLYETLFNPVKALIQVAYPTMPLLVFLAPRPNESGVLGGRNEHSNFNNLAITYINANNYVHPVIHIYFNNNECPVTTINPTAVTYDPAVYYSNLHNYYTDASNQALTNLSLWDLTLSYLNTNMPTKQIYITEWGFANYGEIKNTISLGNVAWKIWNTYGVDNRIMALLQHNGLATGGAGFIFPVNPSVDLNPSNYVNLRRVDFWTYLLFKEITNRISIIISTPGTYHIPYYIGEITPQYTYIDTLKLVNLSKRLVSSTYIYGSSGATGWMDNNSVDNYEIAGIETSTNKSYSFGYVTIEFITNRNHKRCCIN